MRKSKLRIILAVIFCSGVLISGIGVGIGFMEFSSFTYGGEKVIGNQDMKSVALDYAILPDETVTVIRHRYSYVTSENDIKEDKTVPVNTVRFNVRYNAGAVEPYVNRNRDYVYFDYVNVSNDLEIFMSGKDTLLEGIKNREISSYATTGIESVEILVNPETRKQLRVE